MDVVGFLPAPGKSHGAADILGQGAFAYGAGTAVIVLEVHRLHVACTLHGGHRAQVTAVKWCPAYHSRDLKESSHLRLASGDSNGGVVVWDVLTASPIARLEDVPAARELLRDYSSRVAAPDSGPAANNTSSGSASSPAVTGVTSLAWVLPGSSLLAVVLSPALLLLWDVQSGSIVWRRELSTSGSELFSQLSAAPLDSRQLCLCGSSGALVVLQLTDPARDKVQVQQYRVDTRDSNSKGSAPGSTPSSLQAQFAVAPGLLVLLLARELVVFDLELGQPAASSSLPSGLPPFSHLLGVFGSGVCQGGGDEGGLDFAYCTHVDGSLSVWVRVPGELRFKMGSNTRLIPAPIKSASNQASLSVIKACLWQHHQQDVQETAQTAASTAAITKQLTASLAAMHLTREGAAAGTTVGARKAEGSGVPGSTASSATTLSNRSLLVLGVTSDGRQWQWQVSLPQYPKRSFLTSSDTQPITAINASIQAARASAAPAPVSPQLIGLLHGLPSSITATAFQSRPIMLPNQLSKLYMRNTTAQSTPSKQDNNITADPAAPARQNSSVVQAQPEGSIQATDRDSSSSKPLASPQSNKDTASSPAASAAECVVLGAAATATGHVEIFNVRRGLVNPVALEVCMSHAVHKDVVRGVRWLGNTPRVLSFSSEKTSSGQWRNSLVITDVRTGQSLPFRDSLGSEASPMLGIRVSPSGMYLLLLLKGSPCELWTTAPKDSMNPITIAQAAAAAVAAVGPDASAAGMQQEACELVKPWRVRLLDLPFSAVEWVANDDDRLQDTVNVWAPEDLTADVEADEATAADVDGVDASGASDVLQSPPDRHSGGKKRHSKSFSSALSALTSPSMSVAGDSTLDISLPAELLAFGLKDGRSGVLSIRGRKVTDTRPRRPASSPAPGDSVASALAAVWPLLILGDADGTLLAWDLTTGRCSSMATGYGVIRRIQLAPASSPLLSSAIDTALSTPPATPSSSSSAERLRLAVLFTGGRFGVYDLDAAGRIRQTAANPAACSRVGRALDVTWVSMPGSVGAGSILSVVLEDGSLCLVDVAQSPITRPSPRLRQSMLRQLLSTPGPAVCNWVLSGSSSVGAVPVVLMSPRPLGSSMMLQQPWVMLLRYLLQAGISQDALLYLSSNSTDEDDDIRQQLLMMMPRAARATLAHRAAQAQQQTTQQQQQQQQAAARQMSLDPQLLTQQHLQQTVIAKTKSTQLIKGGSGSTILGLTMQGSNSSRLLTAMQQQDAAVERETGDVLQFDGDLVKLLRHIAKLRGSGQLLHADEWRAYSEALSSGSTARRMAVAARLSGHQDEARFWTALPATLTAVKALHTAIQQQQEASSTPKAAGAGSSDLASAGIAFTGPSHNAADDSDVDTVSDYDRMVQQAVEGKAAAGGGTPKASPVSAAAAAASASSGSSASVSPLTRRASSAVPGRVRCSTGPEQLMHEGLGAIRIAAAGRAVRLWDEELVLSDAQERLLWHEALPGQVFESEGMLERRLLEYVVLGDFATAVAFLLSTPPESSVSYYRSVVCALALAATASLRAQSTGNNRSMQAAAATLHLQAAKVVSAHAASIGDNLLGVPLNCSAGLNADAVTLLQEAGMWQYAAVLIARALTGTERAQALSRWSSHVLHQEGSVWRCVGILTTAGCLSAAVQVLRGANLPDCAQAYVQACQQAGLLVKAAPALQQQQQQDIGEPLLPQQQARFSSDAGDKKAADELFGHGSSAQRDLELFDLLGQRTRMLSYNSSNNKNMVAGSEPTSGPDEIRTIAAEYDSYLCSLLASL